MKFFWKVYLSVFITVFSVGMAVVWTSYRLMNHWTSKEYIARYSAFSKVLGDALGNLDTNTEALMLNAAKIVANIDEKHGIPSTEKLYELKDQLKVTQIFVVDRTGEYIRTTNNDLGRIPNVFSFCPQYKKLFTGEISVDSTPLVHPNPEAKPYKFLYVANHDRSRLLEVGVRIDFVAQTLTKALGADPNLISVSMYSPVGEVFGRFTAEGVQFGEGRRPVPVDFPQLIDEGNFLRYFIKVPSSHPKCCQCDIAGTSRNGEYYYVLEAEISKQGLVTLQASMRFVFLVLICGTIFLAFVLSRFVSRRLVANIEKADERVKLIMADGPTKRLNMSGEDEIVFLTQQFDKLLDQLEDSQNKLIESEKLKVKVQLAREVAHNIKSPTIAIEMMMPFLKGVPENVRKVLRDSTKDIRRLTNRLLRQADAGDKQTVAMELSAESVLLKELLDDLVATKNLEHGEGHSPFIVMHSSEEFARAIVSADAGELKAVILNLINNALESYSEGFGFVHVSGAVQEGFSRISIRDSGRGVPPEILEKIGRFEITHGKSQGQGIGLLHAYRSIQNWGGRIDIQSTVGIGTNVTILLPLLALKDGEQPLLSIV